MRTEGQENEWEVNKPRPEFLADGRKERQWIAEKSEREEKYLPASQSDWEKIFSDAVFVTNSVKMTDKVPAHGEKKTVWVIDAAFSPPPAPVPQ